MGHPPVENGRYVDYLPTAVAVPTDARVTVTRERIVTVSFDTLPTRIAGTVRLQGPLASPGVPQPIRDTVDETASIVRAATAERPARARFRRPPDQFPSGPYTMTVRLTGPNALVAGCPEEALEFSRRVFVEFTLLEEDRREAGGGRGGGGGSEGGGGGSGGGSGSGARAATIRSNQRSLLVGDPSSLEFAYLLQFGRFFPEHLALMRYERRRDTAGSTLLRQFAQYFGDLKKYWGYLGQARTLHTLVAMGRDVWRHGGAALADDFCPPAAREWLREFAEATDDVPERNIRIAMNQIEYETSHRELIGRIRQQGPFPRARAARAVQALGYIGKVFDLVDIGVNALQYGERVEIALDQEHSLFQELQRMAEDKDAYSLLKFAQLESVRQSIVRRRAEAYWQLMWAPTSVVGFMPLPGWLGAAIAGALIPVNSIERTNRNEIVDYLEQFANAGLLRTPFQDDIARQGYDAALGGDDAQRTAQRMVTQFSIRAKLLYDLKELVDDNRTREVEDLTNWILRKDEWRLHRRCVFGLRNAYASGARRESGGGNDYVKVHYQEYFPIDFWCGDADEFIRWYRQDNTPEIQLVPGEIESVGWGRVRMPMRVQIRNFADPFGFERNVEGFMFFLPPALTDAEVDEIRPYSADVYTRGWAQRLHRKVSQITNRLDDISRIRDLADYHFYPPFREQFTRGPGGVYEATSQPLNYDIAEKNYLILLFTPVDGRALLNTLFFLCRWPGSGTHLSLFEVKGSKLTQPAGVGATREISFT